MIKAKTKRDAGTYMDPAVPLRAGDKNSVTSNIRQAIRDFHSPALPFKKKAFYRRFFCALGYSVDHLRQSLEERTGMAEPWNVPGMTLEHIVPQWTALTRPELLTLQHWSNLTMLPYAENLAKNSRLPPLADLPADLDWSVKQLFSLARDRGAGEFHDRTDTEWPDEYRARNHFWRRGDEYIHVPPPVYRLEYISGAEVVGTGAEMLELTGATARDLTAWAGGEAAPPESLGIFLILRLA